MEALRTRKLTLGLSDLVVDDLGNLARGHTGKLLGPSRVKSLGRLSLGALLGTLALRLIVVEDPEQVAVMEKHWERREEGKVHARRRASIGKSTMRAVLPAVMSEMGKRGAAVANAKRTKKQRSAAARRAANARWRPSKRKVSPARKAARPSAAP